MGVVLTIDPGQSTGWATWSPSEWPVVAPPIGVGLSKIQAQGDWIQKAEWAGDWLEKFIHLRNVVKIGCELPMFFSDSQVVATEGSLVKLTYLVGIYAGIARAKGIPFIPIPVRDWKGQLPKAIVQKRIEAVLGKKRCVGFSQDIWDAVGIGLWWKGVL